MFSGVSYCQDISYAYANKYETLLVPGVLDTGYST